MQEDFLYFLWQYKLFRAEGLQTVCGQPLTVIKPGLLNSDSGPDFSLAHIRLGEIELIGQVEMHVRSSDWYRHGHETDVAYKNVVLHVVWEDDAQVFHEHPGDLPVLQVSKYIDARYLDQYDKLCSGLELFSCTKHLPKMDPLIMAQWKDRQLIDRLEFQHKQIEKELIRLKGDWHELLYRRIGRAFGLKVNSIAMELLCQQIPYSFVARFRKRKLCIEAIFFGQSGLLPEEPVDDYGLHLQTEYQYWKHHFTMEALKPGVFRFMRMRPSGFPTRRIAQFCTLLRELYPFSQLLSPEITTETLMELLDRETSDYWREHYRFGKKVRGMSASPGKALINLIIINAIVPVQYSMGRIQAKESLIEKAIEHLSILEPEQNKITRLWHELGVCAENSGDSQALYHCFKHFCSTKKCLSCSIGKRILISSNEHDAKDF